MMDLSQYDPIFQAAGREWNVDPVLLKAVATQESAGNPRATSKAGAQGLMQIIPDTQKELGITEPTDPVQSIYGGAKYLSQALSAESTPEDALLYYHGGPKWRDNFGPESKAYVPAVTAHYQKLAAATPPSATPAAPQSAAPSATPNDGYAGFLARTGATTQAPDYAGFLARTGAAPAPQAAPAETETVDIDPMTGAPFMRSQTGQMQPVPGPVTRIAQAAAESVKQGFNDSPSILTPAAQAAVDQGGPVGRWLVNPALRIAGGVLGAGNALMGGASGAIAQGASELGVPALGRDINMAAQVAPAASMGFMHPGISVPAEAPMPRFVQEYYGEGQPGNPLASPATVGVRPNPLASSVPSPAFVPPGSVVPPELSAARPSFVPPNSFTTPEGESVPVSAPPTASRVPPGALPPDAPPQQAAAPVPASVGAAASREQTPPHIVEMTPQEVQAYRSTAEGQKLLEPQQPGVADPNIYVPGVTPNSAEIEQTVNTARELKALNVTAPGVSQEAKEIAAANNEARQDYFAKAAGSDVDIMNAKAARRAQAEKDLAATWPGSVAPDLAPVVGEIKRMLTDPQGKQNTQLKTYIQPLINRLVDENGAPKITAAQELYGFRQDVDRLRQKASPSDLASPEARDLAHVADQLGNVIDASDAAIAKAAPNYTNYMSNYAEASKPIDAMMVLQKHEPKLYDAQNRMAYSRVQQMMRNIVDSRQASGINPYKSIPDETMQKLWALRDDLRRSASAQESAKAPGSDTTQTAFDVVKNALAAHGVESVVHIGAHALLPPVVSDLTATGINKALGAVFSGRTARRQTARGLSLLHPDQSRLRNPLQHP